MRDCDWRPGGLIDQLLNELDPRERLRSLAVGVFWTGAIGSVRGSMAATPFGWNPAEYISYPNAGTYLDQGLGALVERAREGTWGERSIALAGLHACLPKLAKTDSNEDGADFLLRVGAGKRVALLGHFPFVPRLRAAGLDLRVYELPHRLQQGDLPADQLPTDAASIDVLALTSAVIISGQLESSLALAREDTVRVVIGPSAPQHPKLFELGVDALCGTHVLEPEAALASIGQGATHKYIRGLVKVASYHHASTRRSLFMGDESSTAEERKA